MKSKALKKLRVYCKRYGDMDTYTSLEIVNFLMREYAFSKDEMDEIAKKESALMRELFDEWTKESQK